MVNHEARFLWMPMKELLWGFSADRGEVGMIKERTKSSWGMKNFPKIS